MGNMKMAKWIKWVLFVVLSIFLLQFMVKNWDDFAFLKTIHWSDLLLIMGLNLVMFVLISYRFFLTLRLLNENIDFLSCFRYVVVGGFLGMFVPQGAMMYKSVSLKLRNEIGYKVYAAKHLFFYWLNVVISLILGVVVIYATSSNLYVYDVNILMLFIAVLAVMLAVLPVFWVGGKKANLEREKSDFFRHADDVIKDFFYLLDQKQFLFFSIILVALNFFVGVAVLHVAFNMIGVATQPAMLIVYLVLMRLINVVQITPGNWGVREFLFAFLSTSMNISAASGISVSIILRVVGFIVQGTISLLSLSTDSFEKSEK